MLLNEEVNTKTRSVLATLAGASVFVTGATGFIGKVLVEKLLRCVPDIGTIYLLVRPGKDQSADERLNDVIIASEVFSRLRRELGNQEFESLARNKLKAVSGDIGQEQLGISRDAREEIIENVEVVFHVAASVSFKISVESCFNLNVHGSLRVLELAKSCKRLRSMVHTSTSYVNSNRKGAIEERLYEAPMDVHAFVERVSKLSEVEAAKEVKKSGWPNVYTLSKFITEHLLHEQKGDVPLAIVRPSIVGGAWQEPVRGWTDTGSAAGAVYLAARYGLVKSFPGDANIASDVVPVDFVVNALLLTVPAVIAHTDKFMVCHSALSSLKKMLWGDSVKAFMPVWQQYPAQKALSKPDFCFQPNAARQRLHSLLRFTLPSLGLSALAFTTRREKHKKMNEQFKKAARKANNICNLIGFFTSNEWVFDFSIAKSLHDGLQENERDVFWLSVEELDVIEYNRYYCYGLLRYYLKEDGVKELDHVPHAANEPMAAAA